MLLLLFLNKIMCQPKLEILIEETRLKPNLEGENALTNFEVIRNELCIVNGIFLMHMNEEIGFGITT